MRPSRLMQRALAGEIPLSQAPQQWLAFIVYRRAADLVATGDAEKVRQGIERQPESIRELVQTEARRLWSAAANDRKKQ